MTLTPEEFQNWEIYPNENGDAERFLIGEEKEMLEAIEKSLLKIKKEEK